MDPTEDRVWLVHREGFSLGTVIPENMGGKRGSELSRQASLVRGGGRESYKVKLHSGKVLEVEEEDIEKVRHQDSFKAQITSPRNWSVIH